MHILIRFALANRLLVTLFALAVIAGGLWSYRTLPVDAYPDISPALVQVFVETEGLAAEEVEKYVTYPLESAMNGLPEMERIRSVSNFGLSVVNIYFKDRTDIYFARQLVGERLQAARDSIPEGFGEPVMGPITTGLGQILFYRLEDTTGQYSLTQLREIQDWIVKFNLQTMKGVTEVLSIGGEVKQFQVRIKPSALLRYGLSLPDIKDSIEANNANVGAQYIVRNDEEYLVRSVGLAKDLEDLRQIVVKTVQGTPVYLHQLGELTIGGEIRRGLALANGEGEIVVGMVLKLVGANTAEVIAAVKAELHTINSNLPQGLVVKPYYDQAQLVDAAVKTVTDALLQGVVLVALVLLIFMGAWRPSLVVALSIPFSVALSLMAMKALGISANLMSLGGLAIAIGMMVDGAVVVVENIDRHLRKQTEKVSLSLLVQLACQAVARPIVFAIVIIIVVFLPLFSLQGVEGATFRPLAYTVSLAMLSSLVFALIVAPVLATLIMRSAKIQSGKVNKSGLTNIFSHHYRATVATLVAHRWLAAVLAVIVLTVGAAITPRLGSEFVPRFNEGDLLIRATMAPSISLEKARDSMQLFEQRLLAEFPEVTQVVTRVGRGEIGAHADPVNNAEIFVSLKPQSQWQSAQSLDGLYSAMSHAFENFPGATFNFTQPIVAAVDELITGTKSELAAKLFGDDLTVLEAKATEITEVLRTIPGAQDVQQDQVDGTPQVRIALDRQAIARHGLNVNEVQQTLRIAVGGASAGQIFEGIRRFDIYLRLQSTARETMEDLAAVMIVNNAGQYIPLSELAQVESVVGPRQIMRENNQRFITVQANVRERDIGSFVAEADREIRKQMVLPSGYFLRWGGQFELQQQANQRLMLVVPVTLALVFILLFVHFRSLSHALLILLNIPLALVGGVVALWMGGLSLSVPASVGFIALFGIALENGLVLVSYINQLVRDGTAIKTACIEAAQTRLRPVLMTAVTTGLGLAPLLFAAGTGSEVQRPLATVVVGGLVSSTLLTLLILPALYSWFGNRRIG